MVGFSIIQGGSLIVSIGNTDRLNVLEHLNKRRLGSNCLIFGLEILHQAQSIFGSGGNNHGFNGRLL